MTNLLSVGSSEQGLIGIKRTVERYGVFRSHHEFSERERDLVADFVDEYPMHTQRISIHYLVIQRVRSRARAYD